MKLTLGEKLKDERTRRGMTASQVCKELEEKYDCPISMGTYNDIENDKDKNFGYKYFIGLSQLFDVSTDYLFGLTDIRNYNDADKVKAYDYTGLSEESLEILNCLSEGKRLRKKLSIKRAVEQVDIISSIIKYLNEQPLIIYNIVNAIFVNEKSDDDIALMLMYEIGESHKELNKSNYTVLSGIRQKDFFIQEALSDFELILKIIINEFAPKEFVRENSNLKIHSDLSLIAINSGENNTLNDIISGKIKNPFKEDCDNAQHNPKNE